MATLHVKLKQHTPIIHFQHYQDGTTLRASELKPKLDKFLIKYFIENNIDYTQWLIGDGKHNALNYKVKILEDSDINKWIDYVEEPKRKKNGDIITIERNGKSITATNRYPLFFGNMGKNYNNNETIKKFVFTEKPILIMFNSFDNDLIYYIKKNLPDFFALENFGCRQDKGFGSFYISTEDESYEVINSKLFEYDFEIEVNHDNNKEKFKNIFNQLDLFYRAIRAGVNIKDRNSNTQFYCKSLLFLYFKQKGIQWEKKTIKENFFLEDQNNYLGLNSQINKFHDSEVLTYNSENKKLVKDLLGLSTKEEWIYYKNTIEKTEAKNIKGEWVKKNPPKDEIIERFKSPIFFKIINNNGGKYKVYIKLSDDIPIRGKWFIIEEKSGKSFPLQIPDDFNLSDFFQFISDKKKFDITKHVENSFQNSREYKILKNIFEQLQK